ncbi:MAG: hypothetical protein VYB65_02900 [Myxococcota bacterium]|nr:hypothetical protein [Myxococcota bacterium]
MRVGVYLALWVLLAACPREFEAGTPPCDDSSDCTIEALGSDFPDHVCSRDYVCVPKGSVPQADAGAGGQTVYDAGLTSQDASEPQCRRDDDCEPGEICQSGYCLPSGVEPRPDTGAPVDSGASPAADAATPDVSEPDLADAGQPLTPDGG